MRRVRIQRGDHRRPFLNDSNSRVAMTVDPPLVTLGQPKPSFQIEIVLDLFKLALADEEAREEAHHHCGHVKANRILGPLESIDQVLELLLASGAGLLSRLECRGHLGDVLDVVSDRLLFGLNLVQTSVDAIGQAAQLLLREPPFF